MQVVQLLPRLTTPAMSLCRSQMMARGDSLFYSIGEVDLVREEFGLRHGERDDGCLRAKR